jgi:hypothetical protein
MNLLKRILCVSILFSVSFYACAIPDTITNRYATAIDAAFWAHVNEGDFIFFKGNADGGESIYARSNTLNIQLPLGKKILLWKGSYRRIFIEGTNCVSSASQPTIITNLGGQVKWGYSEANNQYRTLELFGFEYLHVTGKYSPAEQTGDPAYTGHNGGLNMDQPDYYEKYGLWGNPKWSDERFYGSFSNIVRIYGFKVCKISYVAASEGGFAGFNIKTDHPVSPGRVEIDIQDCFTGWTESEGVYISYSTSAANEDLTKLTLRNNIFVFPGSEAIQSDNLVEGSVIENNVVFAGACFFRRPFQAEFQDGLHQLSFVEGGIDVRNNIMINGNFLHNIRFKDPGAGRAFPDVNKKVTLKNNYYGYARSNIGYVWQGDGTTQYTLDSNVYGPVSTPSTRDAYTDPETFSSYIKLCNSNTNITFSNNIYPAGRNLFYGACGAALTSSVNNTAQEASLIEFKNSGFASSTDYRKITFWSATYLVTDKAGQFIPYKENEIVFYYDANGVTRFYRCIADHAGDFNPNTSPQYWEPVTWNGRVLPPLDLRLVPGSSYEERDMGLTYKAPVATNVKEAYTDDDAVIYPVPASGELFYKELDGKYTITISDITSRTFIKLTEASSGEKYRSININELPKGVYTLTVKNETQMYVRKFVTGF